MIAIVLSSTAFAFRPIFHPPTVSILDALRNDQENFSILIGLARESGLNELTKEGRSFTLFAPTNAAFDKLPSGTLEGFRKNKNSLRQLLFNHLVTGKFVFYDMLKTEGPSDPCLAPPKMITNLAGGNLALSFVTETKHSPKRYICPS